MNSLLYPYGLWLLFAAPAIAMTVAILSADQQAAAIHEMIHPSGEMSARFLIVAMMATPLAMLLRGWRGPQWMKKNRRYLGVAAFGYALLHTVLYLIDKAALDPVLSDLPKFYIWTGWVAFLIFVPLGHHLARLVRAPHGPLVEMAPALDLCRRRPDARPLGRAE